MAADEEEAVKLSLCNNTVMRAFSIFPKALLVAVLVHTIACSQGVSRSASADSRVKAFLEEEVVLDKYVFPPGRFPHARWRNPERVERLIGEVPLTVEYYDHVFTRVDRAERAGRYGAVIRGTTAEGFPIIRYATLYCCSANMDDYSPDVPIAIRPLTSFGISSIQWKSYQQNLRRYSFGNLLTSPTHDPDAAIFLAGLAEVDTAASAVLTPRVLDRLWWTRFKRREAESSPSISARSVHEVGTSDPRKSASVHAFYSKDQQEQLHRIGSEWTDRSKVPMVALVMHKGKVVYHEAFGRREDGTEISPDVMTWMASITKMLTGVLVMQFVDRGLVDLDAPIDRYLAELRTMQPCPLTLRNLMTHTSGLSWSGEWASDWEPSMENRVAQVVPYVTPGRVFKYHRSGYALASKVLERISGETVPQLFQRMIFDPLEMKHAIAENSYGGLYATASDLGRFGQMLLGRGRLGKAEVLSDSAFAAMLPLPLRLDPGERARSWGIGCTLLGGSGLSQRTFGHEAASGAVLRVDPANDLVVVVGRDNVGTREEEYKQFVDRFLRAVTLPLRNPSDAGHE